VLGLALALARASLAAPGLALLSLDPIPAAPATRPSSIRFGGEAGTGDYVAGDALLTLGLDPSWALVAGTDAYQLGPEMAMEGMLGLDYEAKRSYEVQIGLQGRTGPSSLVSLGPALESTIWLSQAWDGRYATLLAVDLSAVHFRFPILQLDGNEIDRLFWQGGLALGLQQEIPGRLRIGISYARYYYSVSDAILQYLETRSTLLFPDASSGLVSGFPIDGLTGSLTFTFPAGHQLRVEVARTAVVDENVPAYTLSLCAQIALGDHWLVSPQLEGVFQEASGPDYTGGIDFTYAW
jgi:hypothetical protein